MKIIIFSVFLFINSAFALNNLNSYTKEELLHKSFISPSANEKTIIRAYLAKKYPNTQEGLFASAWAAGHNLDNKRRDNLYAQCSSVSCKYNNFINIATAENAYTNYSEFENTFHKENIDFYHYQFLDIIYFSVLGKVSNLDKKTEMKKAFLKKWEHILGSDLYIFDYICIWRG